MATVAPSSGSGVTMSPEPELGATVSIQDLLHREEAAVFYVNNEDTEIDEPEPESRAVTCLKSDLIRKSGAEVDLARHGAGWQKAKVKKTARLIGNTRRPEDRSNCEGQGPGGGRPVRCQVNGRSHHSPRGGRNQRPTPSSPTSHATTMVATKDSGRQGQGHVQGVGPTHRGDIRTPRQG
ncbi:hypothetical protein J8273_2900 [Carpediemonas membranifera]|uniref:Uncharacterized protein n=1 Tax=Carpediemonas membranifera TaxID=201153 RepID=A0A8J6E3J6_9EUKA|nr:hypothetical protein J8273_2900 [Carpediemonas membranifera]|eukprot:KAG9395696.1 hypothetical protein J8273_2900 [Carpediemonas membranifera]